MSTTTTQTIPDSIRALISAENKMANVGTVPFGTEDHVKNLAADDVVVRVKAIGLNPTDWKHAIGEWGKPGFVVGCDSAGDVVKVGSNVSHLKVGDRVAGFTYGTTQKTNGSFAEYVRFNSAVVFKVPEGMAYDEAASFPIPHLTAFQALYIRLGLSKPSAPATTKQETILIWGGSTAVGHHAVQLAALSGLRVFTTASGAAHETLKSLGAHACFDYKDPEVVKKIREAAGESGIQYGLDTACEKGSTDSLVDSIGKAGGRVITILPVSEETTKRRSDVQVEFTLVYTLLGFELNFAGAFPFPAMPEDLRQSKSYVTNEMPKLLEGWKEGSGSPKFKAQNLRKLEGGLERVIEGLRIMQQGAYGREKLVFHFA